MTLKKRGAATGIWMAVVLAVLVLAILGLWRVDTNQVYWIETGEERQNVETRILEKPLALLLDWQTVPGVPAVDTIPRIAQCGLRLAPNTEYTLVVRSSLPLISAQVNGQELYQGDPPMILLGHDLRLRTDATGLFSLAIRLDDEAEMPPPLVLLGRARDIQVHNAMRVSIYIFLSTIVLTGGIVMLLNYLMQGRENATLAIWLLYMLLLLGQMDLLFPQSAIAVVFRDATMLAISACLCCYASLCLGKRSDAPILLGVSFATITLTFLWLFGFAFFGRRIAMELNLPMQGIFLIMTGYFTVSGLFRERAWSNPNTLAYAMVILMLMAGFLADLYLNRTYTMVVSPIMSFGGLMTGIHLWLFSRMQAGSRRRSEELELELERRVADRTEQLRLANKQLGRIDALRGEFFSHIAHDLQSPLTIIRGSLDLVLDETPVTPEERENYLRMARANAEKMTVRIKALRALALLEETAFVPVRQRLLPVMQQCLSNFSAMYRSSGIRFLLEGEDLEATFDSAWLQNALERLVSNAVRYTPPEGSITLGWEPATFGVNVFVADTGCGIAASDLPSLFNRFYKGWNSRDGFGIGLAVVQRVAQRHGGRVWVESETGKGSAFFLFLPDLPAESWQPKEEE